MKTTVIAVALLTALISTSRAFAQEPAEPADERALAERVLLLQQTVREMGDPHPYIIGGVSVGLGLTLAPIAALYFDDGFGPYEGLALGGPAVMVAGGIAAFLIDDPYRAERIAAGSMLGGEGIAIAAFAFLHLRDDSGQPIGDRFHEGPAIAGAAILASSLIIAMSDHPARPLAPLRHRLSTATGRAQFTPDDLSLAESTLRRSSRPFAPRSATLCLAAASILELGLAFGEDDPTERAIDLLSAGITALVALFTLPTLDPYATYTLRLRNAGITVSPTATPSTIGLAVRARY